jgi:hypothetical protein
VEAHEGENCKSHPNKYNPDLYIVVMGLINYSRVTAEPAKETLKAVRE